MTGNEPFSSLAIPAEWSEEDLAELSLLLLKHSLGIALAAGWQWEEMKHQKNSRSAFRLFMTVWGHRQALWDTVGSTGGLALWCPTAAPEGNGASAHVSLTALLPRGGLHIPNQIRHVNGFW